MSIHAATFLAPSVKLLLLRGGYDSVDAVASASPVELMGHCTGLSGADAAFAVRRCAEERSRLRGEGGSAHGPLGTACSVSAHDLLMQEMEFTAPTGDDASGEYANDGAPSATHRIVTFVHELDKILGGGVPLGSILEVCGAPGVGKTQFAMQLLAAVQLKRTLGGADGRGLYVDTEGSFVKARFEQIAQAAVEQVDAFVAGGVAPEWCATSVGELLKGVDYVRFHDLAEVIAFIHALPAVLGMSHSNEERLPSGELKSKPIRLVVIDSLAFHFRYGITDFAQRSRLLFGIAQSLIQTAKRFKVAIIVTNQLTTASSSAVATPSNNGTGGANASDVGLVPALGDAWAHAVPMRLVLRRAGSGASRSGTSPRSSAGYGAPLDAAALERLSTRTATIEKAPGGVGGISCSFVVCAQGIRGAAHDSCASAAAAQDSVPAKRVRGECT